MNKRYRSFKITLPVFAVLLALFALFTLLNREGLFSRNEASYSSSLQDIPAFSGEPYVVINDNNPEFTEKDITANSYEYYSPLDRYGRCGYAMACIGRDLMPTEDRQSISQIKPTGWEQSQYDFVDGGSLYNRCHLIGFQLTGENANERNLITGTRYCNTEGMLPFENMVADYIKETGNHVLYRVTPVFHDQELVARGIQMEAWSVEDNGGGICFHVYVYNNQPGVVIDYVTGINWIDDNGNSAETGSGESAFTYLLNVSSKKFHRLDCPQGMSIKDKNKRTYTGSREDLINMGYAASQCCKP